MSKTFPPFRVPVRLGLLLLLLSASTLFGDDFYVSPTAAANGNGSFNNPWKLQTALDHPSAVQPGDTIWLRGGIYNAPPYTSHLVGTSAEPIIVRQYPGERARIDGNYNGNEVTLTILRQVHLVLGLRDLQLRSHPLHLRTGARPPGAARRPPVGRRHADDQHGRPRHVPGRAHRRGRHRRPHLRERSSTTTAGTRRIAATATASTPRTSARRPSRSTTTSSSSSSAGASTRTARAATSTTSTSRATSPSTTAVSPAAGTPTSSSAVPRTSRPTPS